MNSPITEMILKKHPAGDVTQWFAENPDLYRRLGLAGHNGIDLVRPWGSPLYAIEDGIITDVKNNPKGFGKYIRLMSKDTDEHGLHREWAYAHNAENHVGVGDEVRAGDHIADMGNTGFTISGSTPFWKSNPYAGTHLHLGLRMVEQREDGWSYRGSDIKLHVLDYENGFRGAVDPYPFLIDLLEEVPDANKRMFQQLLTIQSIINSLARIITARR